MNELEKVKNDLYGQEKGANMHNAPVMDFGTAVSNTMQKVYLWMTCALAISGLCAWMVASSESLMQLFYGNPALMIGLVIAELALVIIVSWRIEKLSSSTATLLFILYSIINGITLSSIFLVYTMASITMVFFITAITFAAMALIGYTTKKDMSSWGRYLLMALIGLIVATIVNIFVASTSLMWIVNYAGVIIFVLLTAYDTQMIKKMLISAEGNPEMMEKIGILGALSLYLDFINLFLKLLAIFGNRD